jgi:hypothetical protein
MKGNDVRDEDSVNELAIKIFKTSILVFKDRDKYVSGESSPPAPAVLFGRHLYRARHRATSNGVKRAI